MKPFFSFLFAAVYAGSHVGPYAAVEGRVLFGTVMAAGWGYLVTYLAVWCTEALLNWNSPNAGQ